MINENILKLFKSHTKSPYFSIIITDIQQTEECGQEGIKFTVHQINKSINELELGANIVSRDLHVVSSLDLDENNLYKTKLIGYSSNEKKIKSETGESGIFSHSIEVLDTILQKEIQIKFNKKYEEKPKIITNIEKKYESLYRSISIESITEKIDGKEYYVGANITFNNLKTRIEYPEISIIIIGDVIAKSITITRLPQEIIQISDEGETVIVKVLDEEGNAIIGKTVDLYVEGNYYTENNILITAPNNKVMEGETLPITINVLNQAGDKLKGIEVDLYEETGEE